MENPKLEARNPNTSPERLAELLRGYAAAVLENPALPLILLENPNWLHGAETRSLVKLLQRPELPQLLAELLTRHPKATVRANAEMHIVLREEVTDWQPFLSNLGALSCSYKHRVYLERHRFVPDWLLPYLPPFPPAPPQEQAPPPPPTPAPRGTLTATERAELLAAAFETKATLAQSPQTGPETLVVLAQDPDDNVRYLVATNPNTPLSLLEGMKDSQRCCEGLALNPAVSAEFLEDMLSRHNFTRDYLFFNSVAKHDNCTPALADKLRALGAPSHYFDRFLSITQIEKYYDRGRHWHVVIDLLERDNVPAWLVSEGLMNDTQSYHTLLSWFCALLHTRDDNRIANAARSDNWYNRFAAVLHPATQPKAIEKLTKDANRYIRFAAAARLGESDWSFAKELGA